MQRGALRGPGRTQIGEITEHRGLTGGRAIQQVMDPGPRLPVVAGRHLADVGERFQMRQIRTPTGFDVIRQAGNVLRVQPLPAARAFEIFREPFVEPERQITDCGMKHSVRRLVP